MEEENFIFVEMKEPPRVWLSTVLPDKSVVLNGVEYFDSGNGDFLGFYDFLRNEQGEVIGIRFFPFEEFGFIESEIEIYFSENSGVDETKSDDQFFVNNKLFKSKNGETLITFRAPKEKFGLTSKIFRAEFDEILPKVA